MDSSISIESVDGSEENQPIQLPLLNDESFEMSESFEESMSLSLLPLNEVQEEDEEFEEEIQIDINTPLYDVCLFLSYL